MSKSYSPINPRGRKKKPEWIDERGSPVSSVVTDDTEFGPGYITQYLEGVGSSLSLKTYGYASYRRGKWFYVEIDPSRVKRITKTKELPF